jgi:hypothetical protein
MAKWIDDIIKAVEDHPYISPVHKILLIARIEQNPTKAEIDTAAKRYETERGNK